MVTRMAAAIRITGLTRRTPSSSPQHPGGLARIDPANASTYEANETAFLARLAKRGVGSNWRRSGMPIVAYHNSWPYFARRFRLDFAASSR
jgi:ABC-type Zn uptake system ZnuABC Zn-binding protein ZnuA